MGVILDTSILIGAERGAIRLAALLDSLGDTPTAVAAITASELLHGCHRAPSAAVRARRFAFVDALLGLLPTLPFGLGEARRHAELWAELAREGAPVGPHDMLIGATALAGGHQLATLNVREFSRMPGLLLIPVDRFLT